MKNGTATAFEPKTETPIALELAQWATALELADIPDAVLERIKFHILDQVGAQVSCRNMPAPVIIRNYVTQFGRPGDASILGTKVRSDPEFASLANATSGSAFEIDDYGGNGAYAHPGCVVVPSALAMGEQLSARGADVLRAATVGFETVIRLSRATMPSMFLERGFHQTGSHGVFASGLVSSMIGGFDAVTTAHAIAIAGSHASSTTEYVHGGGEIKRAHGGIGASAGIRAARWAQLGLTGPASIFEGKRGFLQAFCNSYDASFLNRDLGARWYFLDHGAIKPFASCGLIHHHFAAYDQIKARHDFQPDDIEEIVLGCEPLAIVHTGATGPYPTDIVGAQFSMQYSTAMRVVGGRNDVGAYLDAEKEGFSDPQVRAVSGRVRLELDDECGGDIPRGRVTIRLRNGATHSAIDYALGSPFNPLSGADIEKKYIDLVERDFGGDIARRSLDMIMSIEKLTDLRELTRLFEVD